MCNNNGLFGRNGGNCCSWIIAAIIVWLVWSCCGNDDCGNC